MEKRSGTQLLLVSLLVFLLSFFLTHTVEAVLLHFKLSGPLVEGGDVSLMELSPDGKRVVFMADARQDGVVELFSVPASGGTRTLISQGSTTELQVSRFLITPDSQHVIYVINTKSSGIDVGLYIVPINGGVRRELHNDLPGNTRFLNMEISADNQYLVYVINSDPYQVLWKVALAGGLPEIIAGADMDVPENEIIFRLAPQGKHVVYYHKSIFPTLNRATLDGTEADLTYMAGEAWFFEITPDESSVIYKLGIIAPYRLYAVPFGGGMPYELNEPLLGAGTVYNFAISPDSQYVVYRADEIGVGKIELLSIRLDYASHRTILNGPVVDGGNVWMFLITPNSQGVVFIADRITAGLQELWSVPITGGMNYNLSKDMVAGGQVNSFSITPNNLGVVFTANKLALTNIELFANDIFGAHEPWRLNAPLAGFANIGTFRIAPNSSMVAFTADTLADGEYNLSIVPIMGGSTPIRINPPLVSGGRVGPFVISPDNKGVIYHAEQDEDEMYEVYSVFDRFPIYLPMLVR